jgi:hypothetical protein
MPKARANNIIMNYDQQGTGEPLILIPYLAADPGPKRRAGYDGNGLVFTGRISLPDRPDGRVAGCPRERTEGKRAVGASPSNLGRDPPGAVAW